VTSLAAVLFYNSLCVKQHCKQREKRTSSTSKRVYTSNIKVSFFKASSKFI